MEEKTKKGQAGDHDTIVYMSRKDLNSKVTWCNDAMVELLGRNSVQDVIGKTDHDLTWAEQADLYRAGDAVIFTGVHQNCRPEPQDRDGEVIYVMTSKHPIYDKNGHIIELMCCFTDMLNYQNHNAFGELYDGRFALGPLYGNTILSQREYQVLRFILQGVKPHETQRRLNIKKSTYDSIVSRIKIKMGCQTIGDLVYSAIKTQLIHHIFLPENITT